MSRLDPRLLALPLLSILGGGCRLPVGIANKPGVAPRCADGLCVEVVSFSSQSQIVGVWIDAPRGTRLINAHLIADDAPLCQGHLPVEWVTVDERTHPHGPADVSGAHGIVVAFPINAWFGHSGYWRAMFVDLELDVAGHPHCVRTRLTDARGKTAVGL
jgi:hypothetical protein